MAQYDVKHSCGHETAHQLFGKHAERYRKIEWMETTLCLDCWREEQMQQADGDLPALTGSGKQIPWATSIRADAVKAIDEVIDSIRNAGKEIAPEHEAVVTELKSQTSAAWWINHRYVGTNRQVWASIAGKLRAKSRA